MTGVQTCALPISGFVDVLARMGADICHAADTGDLTVCCSALTGTVVHAHEVPGLVDEVPVLAVAAACAEGETRFCGVGELRVKESEGLATIASELGEMGARVAVDGDDLVVVGGGISGLAAAHFYQKEAGPEARILIVDNHDDIGGHAKRNEFHYKDTVWLASVPFFSCPRFQKRMHLLLLLDFYFYFLFFYSTPAERRKRRRGEAP